jgi:hypothetical protein
MSFLTYDALMFEPDIDMAPRLINDNARSGYGCAISVSRRVYFSNFAVVDPFQFGLISTASRSQTKKRALYDGTHAVTSISLDRTNPPTR